MSTGIISVDVEARLGKLDSGLREAEVRVGASAEKMGAHGKTFGDKFAHSFEKTGLKAVLGFHLISLAAEGFGATLKLIKGDVDGFVEALEKMPVVGPFVKLGQEAREFLEYLLHIESATEELKRLQGEDTDQKRINDLTEKRNKALEPFGKPIDKTILASRRELGSLRIDDSSGKEIADLESKRNKQREEAQEAVDKAVSAVSITEEQRLMILDKANTALYLQNKIIDEQIRIVKKRKVEEDRQKIIAERESIFDANVAFDKEEFDTHQKNMADLMKIDTDTGVKRLELMGKTLDAELFKIGRAMDERRMLSKTSAEAEALDQLEVVEKQLAIRTAKEKEFHEAQEKKEKDFGILETFVNMTKETHPRQSGSEVVLLRTAAFGGTQDRIKSPLEIKAEQQLAALKAIEANTRRKEVVNILGGDR